MPANRKILSAAAFSLALAGGGVAGALLGTPTSSGAQDETTETTTEAHSAPHVEGRGMGLTAAAEAIGISEDDLRTALEDGQSIADVAEANGVLVQTVIDAMVAAGTESLEAAIDELPDRITDLVHRDGLPMGGGHGPGGHGGGFGGRGLGFDAAAEAIGISADDLRTALQDGSTIAEVAEANGVELQTVIDALVAEATTRLDETVTAGDLTEDEAAEREAELTERITEMVNGSFQGPPGHGGPPGGTDDADATAT